MTETTMLPELKVDANTTTAAEISDVDMPQRYKVHWYRGTIFQILVVGGVFFCVRRRNFHMYCHLTLIRNLSNRPQ